ncbi:MAG: hypothetical protein RI947_693 [Candidatus Parcubacteria bacterium]|jgi:cob(I)alamin adenosyltransferase
MVKIYTKTGDKGTTALFGGKRVLKSDDQVDAYGNVDELTSFIGLLIAHLDQSDTTAELTAIQKDLYKQMAFLAGMNTPIPDLEKRVSHLEELIDTVEKTLPKLTRFILPQGGVVSSLFHVVRTVCRRAERSVVRLAQNHTQNEDTLKQCLVYLNRLSDLMFVMGRKYEETKEIVT